jgi:hypothetical protein
MRAKLYRVPSQAMLLIAVLLLITRTQATELRQVYEMQFSVDPGWTVSDDTRYAWDHAKELFRSRRININGGGTHAYHDVGSPFAERSFRLEWDIMPVSVAYACDARFGIFDTDLLTDGKGSYAYIGFTREDGGQLMALHAAGKTGKAQSTVSVPRQFKEGKWYHVNMAYDAAKRSLLATITDPGSNKELATLAIDGIGPFAADMDRIGTSDHRRGRYQVRGAEAEAYYDNVALYVEAVPAVDVRSVRREPAMLIHLTSGETVSYRLSEINRVTYTSRRAVSPPSAGRPGTTTGLVAYYPFNGDTKDHSGNGNDGSAKGAALADDRFGDHNRAYSLDGHDDCIVVPHSPSFRFHGPFTLAAWFRPAAGWKSGYLVMKGRYLSSEAFSLIVRERGEGPLFRAEFGGKTFSVQSKRIPAPSSWYHVAGVYDGDSLTIYLNGKAQGSVKVNGRLAQNQEPLCIGCDYAKPAGMGASVGGRVDDVRVYSRALSARDIASLYERHGSVSDRVVPDR